MVKNILRCLSKLISGKKIYAANNPVLAKFSEEFETSLRDFFENEQELVLMIEQFSIKWQDEVVYENEKREESLAFLLYKDGIGEVTLLGDVTAHEIDRFVDILKDEFHSVSEDEDMVTKLWKADFRAITYRVLEDYLSGEVGEAAGDAPASVPSTLDTEDHEELMASLRDRGRVIIEPFDPIESIGEYLRDQARRSCPTSDEAELEAAFQKTAMSHFEASSDELNLYHERHLVEKGSDGLKGLVQSILDFTLLKDHPTIVRDTSSVTERLVDYTVEESNVKALSGTLALIRDFIKKHQLTENTASLCRSLEARLCERSFLLALGRRIKQWGKEAVEILEYFSLVGKEAVEPLCEILQEIEEQRVHREICDVLTSMSGKEIPSIVSRLKFENAQIACDAVYMMRQAKIHSISPRLRELIHYPDARVKEEMIDYLSEIDSKEVLSLLFKMLEDPEKEIRIKVLEALQGRKEPEVLEKVSDMAFTKGVAHPSLDEQEAIFKTLGRIGNEETVKRIAKMLEKRRFWHFSASRESKFLAIIALENIHTRKSLGVLEKLAKDSNSLVKGRATRASANMREHLGKPSRDSEER